MHSDKIVKEKEQLYKASQNGRHRDLLLKILRSKPKNITIGEWDEKGDLKFAIPMSEFGLEYKDYQKYSGEISSHFVVDFVGELIIRENLDLFVEKLKHYDINDYMIALGSEDERICHKRFGAETKNGKFIFEFHVSFLSQLLTENFRKALG